MAIDHEHAEIFDVAGRPVDRPMVQVSASAAMVEKGNYRHFMEKEIHDQPDACQHTLSAYLDPVAGKAKPPTGFDFRSVERIQIVACGTAYLAGLTAKYLFEKMAGLPVDVEIASEFRYRDPALSPSTLALAISQSGETADTLAALKWCKAKGLKTCRPGQRPPVHHGAGGGRHAAHQRRGRGGGRLHQGVSRPRSAPCRPW